MDATINVIAQSQLGTGSQRLKLVNIFEKVAKSISCIYIHRDLLFIGTRNSKLYIYRIKGNDIESQKFLTPHCEAVSSIIVNDSFIITIPQIDEQCEISVWQAQSRLFVTALKGHRSQISKVMFLNQEEEHLASASWDGTVRIWSLKNLERDEHQKIYKGTYPILDVVQTNREVLAFGGDDCYLVFWNWRKQQVITKVFGHAGSVTHIHSLMPYLLTCGGDGKFKFWLVNTDVGMKQGRQNELSYNIKVIKQDKKKYDSNIYSIAVNHKIIYLIDREGQSFSASLDLISKMGKQFDYYENVSGLAKHGNNLILTTTKGTLKIYKMGGVQQMEEEEIKIRKD